MPKYLREIHYVDPSTKQNHKVLLYSEVMLGFVIEDRVQDERGHFDTDPTYLHSHSQPACEKHIDDFLASNKVSEVVVIA